MLKVKSHKIRAQDAPSFAVTALRRQHPERRDHNATGGLDRPAGRSTPAASPLPNAPLQPDNVNVAAPASKRPVRDRLAGAPSFTSRAAHSQDWKSQRSSSSSALAFFRSAVSKPSVNQS
jgi:hypothetical protein